ncbi:MAG TPA: OmpA family protein, partial [Flavobacteriia bacterium]|nr:OmpA family protein [Flavobacteriia bacterium]
LRFLVIGVFRGSDGGPPVNGRPDHNAFYIDDVVIKKIRISEEIQDVAFFCKYNKDESIEKFPDIGGVVCHFSTNSSEVHSNEKIVLDSFAHRLKRNPKIVFTVIGHTDGQGDNHIELSRERIASVLKYLKEIHKIPEFRFVKIYAGNTMPIANDETENGRRLNRRVEFIQSDYDLPSVFYRNLLLSVENGDIDRAYKILFAWLHIVKDKYKMLMYFDPRIEAMRKDQRWEQVTKRIKKSYDNLIRPELAFTLDSLWAEDQKPRTLRYRIENLNTYIKEFDEGDPKWDVFFEISSDSVIYRDSQIFLFVDSVVANKGWPKISEVGPRPAKVVFLATTHSNDTTALSGYIPIVESRCMEGEAEWYWYATMYDRLATLKGLPQKYGTQYRLLGGHDNKKELFPLEDKSKVNEWRAKIGMPPIRID